MSKQSDREAGGHEAGKVGSQAEGERDGGNWLHKKKKLLVETIQFSRDGTNPLISDLLNIKYPSEWYSANVGLLLGFGMVVQMDYKAVDLVSWESH